MTPSLTKRCSGHHHPCFPPIVSSLCSPRLYFPMPLLYQIEAARVIPRYAKGLGGLAVLYKPPLCPQRGKPRPVGPIP